MTSYGFVHLEYGQQHRKRSLEFLGRLQRDLVGANQRSSLVVVDNANSAPPWPLPEFESALFVAGDNSNREFSGWDRGVAGLLSRIDEPDVWIFSNDTVATHHAWSRQRISRFAQEIQKLETHARPWLLGNINDFPRSTMTPLGPLLEWVATFCFAMNGSLRTRLASLSPDNALLDSLVHEKFEPGRALFRESVDPAYVDFVSAWLISNAGDPERKRRFKWSHEWHKASPLSPGTFDDLRMKARCCLSESMLSVRARQLGADIRSPYEARNAREHLRQSWQLIQDKIYERRALRRLRRQPN